MGKSETLEWATNIIKPRLPEYDEKDHELAKLRFVIFTITEMVSNEVYKFHHEDNHSDAVAGLWALFYGMDADKLVVNGLSPLDINAFAKTHKWDSIRDAHLYGHHAGDCTGMAAGCAKCHAERFYNFTSPYEGNDKGHKALTLFLENEYNEKR